jgi:hypothetical protein
MSPCGCKGKKVEQPSQEPAKIIYVENGEVKARTPAPSPLVPADDVQNIVNKLNEISS